VVESPDPAALAFFASCNGFPRPLYLLDLVSWSALIYCGVTAGRQARLAAPSTIGR
jgi:hypothetical protein